MERPAIIVAKTDHERLLTMANGLIERKPELAEELIGELERARIVEDGAVPTGTVQMGSTLEYRTEGGVARHVTLVYPADADIASGRISILTPVGTALLGMAVGQTIDFTANDGRQHFLTIASVTPRLHPNYFVSSWQDDSQGESAGALAQSLGYKRAFLIAPNYQAGKETMEAFKRFYKGEVVGETYTSLDQADFAAEMAQIRNAKPDVVYEFEPGGLGIAFMRQYQQAGLLKDIPMVVHPASLDHVIVQAVGDAAQGVQVTSHWNDDFDNPVNKAFVAAWKAKFGDRPITYYAAQGYDAALLIGTGLEKSGIDDVPAFRKALLTSDIKSVRGSFKFGPNQHPVQDWYALKAEKGADGKMVLKTESKVLTAHSDSYAADCKMPAE